MILVFVDTMDQAQGQIQINDEDTEACNDSTSEEDDSFDPQDNSVDTAEMELISQRMGEGKLIPPRPIRYHRAFPLQDTLNETNEETLGTTDSFDINSDTITESMHERVATERGARARPQRVNRERKPEDGLNDEQSTLDTSSTPTEDTFNSQDNSASQTFLDRINKIKDEAPPRPRPNRHGLPSTAVAVVGLETESEGSQEASFRVDISEANNDENGENQGTSVEATPPAFSSGLTHISASDSAGTSQESDSSVSPEIAVRDKDAGDVLRPLHTLSRQETAGETYLMDDFSEMESDVSLPVSPAAHHSSNDRSSTLSIRSSSVQVHDQNPLNFREETAALGHSLNVRKSNNSNKSHIQAPLELEVSGTIQTNKSSEAAHETRPRPESRSDNSSYSDASSSKRNQPQAQEFNYTSGESEGTVLSEHSTQCFETNVSKQRKYQTGNRLSSLKNLRHSEKSIQRTTKSHSKSPVKLSDKELILDRPLSRLSQNYITRQAKTSDNLTSTNQSVIPEESSEEELFVADEPSGQRSQTSNSKEAEKSRRKTEKSLIPQLLSDDGSAFDTPPNRLSSVKGSRQSEKSNHRTTKSQSEVARDSSRNSLFAEELSKRCSQSSTENRVSKASELPTLDGASNDESLLPSVRISTNLIINKSKSKNRVSRTFLASPEVSLDDRLESDSKESGSLNLRINSISQSLRSSAEMQEEAAVDSEHTGEISDLEVIDDVQNEREQEENIQQSYGNLEFSHGSCNFSSNRFSETATLSQLELRGDTLLSSSSNASVPSAALVSQGPTLMQFNILLYEALVRSAGYQDVLALDDFSKFKDCPVSKPEPKVEMIHETIRRFPYIALKPADKKNAEQFLVMKQQQQSMTKTTLAMDEGSYSQSENENQKEIHPKRRRSRNGKDSRASASKRNTKPPVEIYSQVMDYHKSQLNSMSQSQQSQLSQKTIPETRAEYLTEAAAGVSADCVLPPASSSDSTEPRALPRNLISDFVDENVQIDETNARVREISLPVTTVIAASSSIPGIVGVGQKNKVNTSAALIVPVASSTSNSRAIPAIASNTTFVTISSSAQDLPNKQSHSKAKKSLPVRKGTVQETPDSCSENNLSLAIASSTDNSAKDTDGDSDFESHSGHRKYSRRLTQVTPKRNSSGILSRTRLSLPASDAEHKSEPPEEENDEEREHSPSSNNIRSLSISKRNDEDLNGKENDQNEASSEKSAVDIVAEPETAEYNDENIDNYQNQEESSSRGEVDNPPIDGQFVDAEAQESDDGRSDDGNDRSNDLSEEDHNQQDRQEEVEAEIRSSNRVSEATSSLPVASNSIVASTLHRSPRSSHPHSSGSRFDHGTPSPSQRLEVASLSHKRNRQSILRESKTPSPVSKTPNSFPQSNSNKKNSSVNNRQRLSESDVGSKSPSPKRSRHDENQNQSHASSNSRRLQNRSESVDQHQFSDPDPTPAAVSLPRSSIGAKGSKINSVSVPTRKSTTEVTEVSRRVRATVPMPVQTSGAGASNIASAKAPASKKAKKVKVKKDVNYYMSNKNLISKETVKYSLQELNITMSRQKMDDLHKYLNFKFEKFLDKLMKNAGRPNGMFTYRQLEAACEHENLLPKGLGKNPLYIMFAETLCYTDFEKCKGLLIPKDHEIDTFDF